MYRRIIELLDILDQINNKTRVLPRIEVDHVSERSIRKRGAINRNIILPAPVVDRILVVDPLPDSLDDFLRSEKHPILLLLFVHLIHQRQEPTLKKRVILGGHEQITNSVPAFLA